MTCFPESGGELERAVAAFAVPWDHFGSNSLVLLDMFQMIAPGLRDVTQELYYSGSPELVCRKLLWLPYRGVGIIILIVNV